VKAPRHLRVVFDTNTVLSALLFSQGEIAWLRAFWREGRSIPLISSAAASELTRVLAYPKFGLSPDDCIELLSDYLPFCQTVIIAKVCPVNCRDKNDQPFLNLAHSGRAHVLVTGDKDLLALAGKTSFVIESPESFRQRISEIKP
jgi:putative PIN family toxin of toxin-antitoxin system